MSPSTPRKLIAHTFARAAADYARSLQLEDFMEATSQATQRKITLESLDLVHAHRPDVEESPSKPCVGGRARIDCAEEIDAAKKIVRPQAGKL